MITEKICLCFKNELTLSKVVSILNSYGYSVIEKSTGGKDCIEKVRNMIPDITILEHNVLNSMELLKVILKESYTNVIFVVSEDRIADIKDFISEENFTYLFKPMNRSILKCVIELIIKQRKKLKKLEAKIENLENTLAERKEVEKAKGLLMKYLKLTEAEAFRKIQKQSMDKGVPMFDVAKAIIIAYDI